MQNTLNRHKAILLLSGGIDSTTMLAWLREQDMAVYALSFDYGQKHMAELELASQNAIQYKVVEHHTVKIENSLFQQKSSLTNENINVGTYILGEKPQGITDSFVPSRNLLFISYAVSFAETHCIQDIYLAFNADDSVNFPDCSKSFLSAVNEILKIQTCLPTAPKVLAPFIDKSKAEVIELSCKLGVDLAFTLSCYQPKGFVECGRCLSCHVKQEGISKANLIGNN